MTSDSATARARSIVLVALAGLACAEGACGLGSLDFLENGHRQDGAARDSARRDDTTPSTPSPDTAILDVPRLDLSVVGGAGGNGGPSAGGADGGMTTPDAVGAGGTTGSGGALVPLDAGRAVGSGGRPGLDAPMEAGGFIASGGNTAVGGSVGSGGFANSGGSVGVGGSTNADSGTKQDTSASTGGIAGTGGAVATGGAIGTGGTLSTGGAVATGGTVGTGGAGTGGTSAATCGTTKSTFAQTITFGARDGGSAPLAISPAVPPAGAQLTYTTVGPATNPTLCAPGCAALSMTYAAGSAAYATSVSSIEFLSPMANLVGATVTFTIAIDDPGTKAPIELQAYATGDANSQWSWSAGTSITGTGLTPYAAENTPAGAGKTLSTTLVDHTGRPGTYCASATYIIGLQLQNTGAITATNAGPVTIYITSITITPPP